MPDARKTLRNAADEVPLPKSRSSGARRAKAMCAVQAFGLLEYSSLPARSVLRDESRGERSGRGSALLKAGSQVQGMQRRRARCGPLAYRSTLAFAERSV